MRVIHTVASLHPRFGGPSRSIPALVAALREQRVDAQLHPWDERGWSARERADLIHDHGIWLPTNHRAARISRRMEVPRVVSVRGMLEPWAMRHHGWKKRIAWQVFQRRDLERAAVIHATSAAEAENIRASGLRNPIAVIPNGVEVPVEREWLAGQRTRRVLFLSRLHRKKGLPLLLRAWAAVRPQDWELAIAGPDEGGHLAQLEAMAVDLGGCERVHFLGAVADADKWRLYRSADLFVLPTYSENFGLVVAEALAAAVPVITTRGAPWAELETRGCGWWVEPEADALAGALRSALTLSDEERRRMGLAGRALVQERYSWSSVARQMAAVYEWLKRGSEPPACIRQG